MQHLPIHPSLLHPLTGEPLRALWVRPDGRICWPILGGDGTDDDANDDAKSENGNGDEADGDSEGDERKDDGAKDDDGEVDWKARFEAEQRHKKNLERKARKDAATIARLTGEKPKGGSKDDDADPEKIREQAKAEVVAELMQGRVEDKIEAKASAFADPEDAVAVLLRSHGHNDFLDDKNQIDVEAITDALAELGEKKPHLLAQGGKRFQGDADGGSRKEKPTRAKSLGEAINRHYEKS